MNIESETRIIKSIRKYFDLEGFLEVFVPHLYNYPNLDGEISNFITFFEYNGNRKVKYLTTSPEYFLKYILSYGYNKIYNISSAFRNGENDDMHLPEFLLLEWYEPGKDLDILVKRVVDLLKFVYEKEYKYSIFDMRSLLEDIGLNINSLNDIDYMKDKAREFSILIDKSFSLSDIFWAIFYEQIEKKLPKKGLFFIKYFPVFTGGMAQCDEKKIFSRRVEAYLNGIELANGYVELLNGKEMLNRMKDHAMNHSYRYWNDKKFADSLDSIKEEFVGMALGIHRLPGFNMDFWRKLMEL